MRNAPCLWATMAFAACVGGASAQEERVVQACERLGAVVKRDETKPNRPVIALHFGLRNPIPDSIPELDKDVLLIQLRSKDLGTPKVERSKATDADRTNGGKPLDPSCPAAIMVTDADLKEVSKLAHLQVLDLSYSQITDQGLQHLRALNHLHTLDLRNTRIDDAGLQILREFKSLRRLYLTNCPVTDKGLVHLRQLPNLEELFLRGGKELWEKGSGALIPPYFDQWFWKNEVTDKGMAELKALKNLQKLYLNGYRLTDEGLKELRELTNLRELTLDVTGVTDEGLKHLSSLKRLEKLSLEATKVTDAGLKHLSGLDRLETLDLCGTQVTDAGMKSLQKLKNLRRLSLAFTPATDKGFNELNRFQRLEQVDLPGSLAARADGEAQAKAKKALPKLKLGPIYQFPGWYEKYCQHREERFQQQAGQAMQAWLQEQHLPEMQRSSSPSPWHREGFEIAGGHLLVLVFAFAVFIIFLAVWGVLALAGMMTCWLRRKKSWIKTPGAGNK